MASFVTMARIQFNRDYNHRWPSRAVTHFRAEGGPSGDGTYTVKREVAQAAERAGKGTWLDKSDKPPADGSERETIDGMAVRDPAADRDDAPRDELESDAGTRGGDVLPEPDSAG